MCCQQHCSAAEAASHRDLYYIHFTLNRQQGDKLRYHSTAWHRAEHSSKMELTMKLENAWQSLAYSPLGAVVSPPSEY